MGEKLFFSGKNVQQALLSAARKLGLQPDEIAYLDRTKAHGALKASRAVIEVDGDEPRRAIPAPVPAAGALTKPAQSPVSPDPPVPANPPNAAISGAASAISPAPPIRPRGGRVVESRSPSAERRSPAQGLPSDVAPEQLKEAAEEAARLLATVAGARLQPEARVVEGVVEVDLAPGGSSPVTVSPESLQAVQHLLPRVLRGLVGSSVPCRVDLGGARRVREEQLRDEALRAARDASLQGRAVSLAPMGAADRRVVHMALREVPGVRTESEGAGETRAVVVRPA
jgi:spoIIIJ-associated protein